MLMFSVKPQLILLGWVTVSAVIVPQLYIQFTFSRVLALLINDVFDQVAKVLIKLGASANTSFASCIVRGGEHPDEVNTQCVNISCCCLYCSFHPIICHQWDVSHWLGAKSRSMGGVGIGYAQDGFVNAANPAAITGLGTRVDLDMMLFYPKRQVTIPDPRPIPNAGNPINYRSGANLFLIPAMAGVYKFNRKLTLGFSFVGSGGGNTRYTRLSPLGVNFLNPAQRNDVSDTLGVNLLQAQLAMTVAYRLTKNHSIGFSPVFGAASFRAYGLGVFKTRSADPDNLTGRGNDFAYGAGVRIGWSGKLHERLTVGAAYQSRIYFTKFDKYKGLFAEQGSLDSPENFGVGLAFKATDKLDIAFDVQHCSVQRYQRDW